MVGTSCFFQLTIQKNCPKQFWSLKSKLDIPRTTSPIPASFAENWIWCRCRCPGKQVESIGPGWNPPLEVVRRGGVLRNHFFSQAAEGMSYLTGRLYRWNLGLFLGLLNHTIVNIVIVKRGLGPVVIGVSIAHIILIFTGWILNRLSIIKCTCYMSNWPMEPSIIFTVRRFIDVFMVSHTIHVWYIYIPTLSWCLW